MIPRYEDPKIRLIFSEQEKIRRWVQIEVAAMKALGHDPGETVVPDPVQVGAQERITRHDVVAFIRAWLALNPENETLQRWVHYGLTSSNVTDTALGMAIDQATDRISDKVRDLVSQVLSIAQDLVGVPQVARTHGRYAQVRPAHHPWYVYRTVLRRQFLRLMSATQAAAVGALRGPVGIGRIIDVRDEDQALAGLGLGSPEYVTQIVPRDGLAAWAASLSHIATTCEAMATQIRLLSQSGIQEVGPKPAARHGTVGSSAMPHKVNPALAENICGLARMIRPIPAQLELGIIQWGEHDLAHSSVERVQVETLCHLMVAILDRTQQLLQQTKWDSDQMAANVELAEDLGEARSNQWLMDMVDHGYSYLEAHEAIQKRIETKQWWVEPTAPREDEAKQ